jgi:hypothetical protein
MLFILPCCCSLEGSAAWKQGCQKNSPRAASRALTPQTRAQLYERSIPKSQSDQHHQFPSRTTSQMNGTDTRSALRTVIASERYSRPFAIEAPPETQPNATMAASNDRTSTYTQVSASSDHDRPKSADAKKDMWSSMLDSVASGKRLPEKNILVLGPLICPELLVATFDFL